MARMMAMTECEKSLFNDVVLCPVENQACYAWRHYNKSVRCDDCPLVQSSEGTAK